MNSWAAIAAVLVAVITGPVAIAVNAVVQRRVHRENRDDHAATAAKVAAIHEDLKVVRADVVDVKADIRELKSADRALGARVDVLEHPKEEHR